MNPTFGYHEQQQYQHEHQQNILINDALHAEELYFADYDHAMQLEAEYFDRQQHEHNDDEYNQDLTSNNDNDDDDTQQNEEEYDDDEMMDMDDTAYYYQDDTLLKLIVDVQLYMSDSANVGMDRNDSPLVGLQYKMYTYLKQRAYDMGVDANSLM